MSHTGDIYREMGVASPALLSYDTDEDGAITAIVARMEIARRDISASADQASATSFLGRALAKAMRRHLRMDSHARSAAMESAHVETFDTPDGKVRVGIMIDIPHVVPTVRPRAKEERTSAVNNPVSEFDSVSVNELEPTSIKLVCMHRGEIITIKMGNTSFECSCKEWLEKLKCDHMNAALREALDQPFVAQWLNADPSTVSWIWKVPLFATPEPALGMFSVMVEVRHKRMGGKTYGEVHLEVPSESPAIDTEGSWAGGGRKYHRIGILGPADGREAMRAMVASWVSAQSAMIDRIPACSGFFHDATSRTNRDPREDACIILTGECITCQVSEFAFDDDVPSF